MIQYGSIYSFKVTDLSSLFIYACFYRAYCCYVMPNISADSGICLSVCMGQWVCFCSVGLLWALFSWALFRQLQSTWILLQWITSTMITGPEHIVNTLWFHPLPFVALILASLKTFNHIMTVFFKSSGSSWEHHQDELVSSAKPSRFGWSFSLWI